MILEIRVVPKSSRNLVKKQDKGLKVYLTKPAEDGLANKQLVDLLSEYLKVKRYRIKIIKGHNRRDKLVEISA